MPTSITLPNVKNISRRSDIKKDNPLLSRQDSRKNKKTE
jgi:hypothetical protein